MSAPPFRRVVVDPAAADDAFTVGLLGRLPPGLPVEPLEAGAGVPRGKGTLFVTREPGAFVKPCPCSPGVVGCGYLVFTLGFQCPFGCSYCFLRFYAPQEPLTLYANLDDARVAFERFLAEHPGPARLGTGEFTDSLALDPWTAHSEWLVELVRPHPRVLLELKTKSEHVERLLGLPPAPNVVIAWSLNPQARVEADEPGTASLRARLDSAARVAAAGFPVAFHFDPVVLEEGWQEEYRAVIDAVAKAVAVRSIAWVSLGTLRFPSRFLDRWGPALKGRRAFFGELLQGPDGKARYFWPLRRAAYRLLRSELALRLPGAPVYLCMESPEMWGAALGRVPGEGEVEECLTRARPEGPESRAGGAP